MKIVSWNCHYGLDKNKFKKIVNHKDFGNANVYAFQEVLENEFTDIADFDEKNVYKYRHWYGDHKEYGNCHIPRGAEGDLGIVLMSKDYKIQRFDQGLIKFRYVVPYLMTNKSDTKDKFILIHVWTKGQPDGYIKPIYDALEFYNEQFELNDMKKVLMLGDFNFGIDFKNNQHRKILTEIEEKIKGIGKGLIRSEKFSNSETFKYARNGNFYFNDCIYTKDINVKNIVIGNKNDWIDSNMSDHCPIMAELALNN